MPFKDFTTEILTSADVDLYLMSQVIIRCTSATRPAAPAQGWHIYETDTQRFLVYNGSLWTAEGGSALYKCKAVDESVASSATLQDDDDMFFSVEANTVYSVQGTLIVTGVSSVGLKCGFSVPSGASMSWCLTGITISTTPSGANPVWTTRLTATDNAVVNCGATAQQYFLHGTLRVGGTAGAVPFRWAQQSSNATATVLRADSWLRLEKMA